MKARSILPRHRPLGAAVGDHLLFCGDTGTWPMFEAVMGIALNQSPHDFRLRKIRQSFGVLSSVLCTNPLSFFDWTKRPVDVGQVLLPATVVVLWLYSTPQRDAPGCDVEGSFQR
jgi:hypothetical protein